ncbi:MAG: DUF302 domain-containing protein [Microcystis aeruginosa L211-07]|nr:DUF302 domain-containing protein [Microcystis aeruginosa L211-07]
MYYFSQMLEVPFQQVIAEVTAALQQEGFGILTDIDVKATLKKKIDVDFRPYRILGACHPLIAYQMLQIDDKAGVLYPCNLVVQEQEDGRIEVSAIDPMSMFRSLEQPQAREIAETARQKLQAVMEHLKPLVKTA